MIHILAYTKCAGFFQQSAIRLGQLLNFLINVALVKPNFTISTRIIEKSFVHQTLKLKVAHLARLKLVALNLKANVLKVALRPRYIAFNFKLLFQHHMSLLQYVDQLKRWSKAKAVAPICKECQ